MTITRKQPRKHLRQLDAAQLEAVGDGICKESLRVLGAGDLAVVAGGIDVDGSGRAIIIYGAPDPARTNLQLDTAVSR